jgi:hypothetical protein
VEPRRGPGSRRSRIAGGGRAGARERRGRIAGRGERSQAEGSDRTWSGAIAGGGERSQLEVPGAIAGGGVRWRENQHSGRSQTNTFQEPVFGNQECRNLHDVRRSTGIGKHSEAVSSRARRPAGSRAEARRAPSQAAFCNLKSCGDLRPGLVTWTRSGISLHAMYDI